LLDERVVWTKGWWGMVVYCTVHSDNDAYQAHIVHSDNDAYQAHIVHKQYTINSIYLFHRLMFLRPNNRTRSALLFWVVAVRDPERRESPVTGLIIQTRKGSP
jgi:hypothetical protein